MATTHARWISGTRRGDTKKGEEDDDHHSQDLLGSQRRLALVVLGCLLTITHLT
jgi:hypothetical protein